MGLREHPSIDWLITASNERSGIRILLVDLNNFARFPTMSVGYLAAVLRAAGSDVHVVSPLANGMPAEQRERREVLTDRIKRRVYLNTHPAFQPLQPIVRNVHSRWEQRPNRTVLRIVENAIHERSPEILLLSAYLDQYPSVAAIGEVAQRHRIPLLVGGPAFSQSATVRTWLQLPGLTALIGAEVDHSLMQIVRAALGAGDLSSLPGVTMPDGTGGTPAPPLASLAGLPIPDFSDFPWHRYPHRILPVMTGRGCEWGRCIFCSDVTTVNGRTFRSRPVEDVLEELRVNGERYRTRDVVFLDIKMNSDLAMWRSIIERYQEVLPGGRWVATVHVGRGENGLSPEEMRDAARAGLTRVSFGLETGSQRLNDSMAKGTNVEDMSAFIRSAHAAGISVRATMMTGYPGERASDIVRTVRFLDQHDDLLDRVRLSRFKAIPGTRFQELFDGDDRRFPDVQNLRWDHRLGRASYTSLTPGTKLYRRAKGHLVRAIDNINRKELRDGTVQFDGLM